MTRFIIVLFGLWSLLHNPVDNVSAHEQTPSAPQDTIFYPLLTYVHPSWGARGDAVTVYGTGGYVVTDDGGLIEGYPFSLYFGDQHLGVIWCVFMECARTFIVPSDAAPGEHRIRVAGGSNLAFQVVEVSYHTYFVSIRQSGEGWPPPPPPLD